MKLYNTLKRKTEEVQPIQAGKVRIYSCGPTVYDHIHIGNLSAFIYADTLRRVISAQNLNVRHVMNFTDVDDKTIRRSHIKYPDMPPIKALQKLTSEYSKLFLQDMQAIGNDTGVMEFINATDSIEAIRQLIKELHDGGYAYITDDGVYFSIEKYRASGKTYGQLLKLSTANTSSSRIDNDEYEKDNVHDFALWKVKKPGEPAWDFELDGQDLSGRPGWHIECSAMSLSKLGQPFDIHTGGVDLIFPHHENEIAQSTAGNSEVYANYFFHNEHLLVDGQKMSKSLNNFYTLDDILKKGYDPLAFRLMVLQSHYRSQSNFTWVNLDAAQNRLQDIYAWADLIFQPMTHQTGLVGNFEATGSVILKSMADDLNTPRALGFLSGFLSQCSTDGINPGAMHSLLTILDDIFGLELSKRQDIKEEQRFILAGRQQARNDEDWAKSDELRNVLKLQGLGVRDTDNGQIWFRF